MFNSRFPNANELFSEGLHHGIATIEFGNQKLKQEHGIKWVNTLSTQYKKLIKLELNFYVTKIKNYILRLETSLNKNLYDKIEKE